jgi:DNA-binding transcriptional LysR family regulator
MAVFTPFDLELFVALADTGSLTAAAEVCSVTRGTIARRLSALEERLGVTLVNRTTRDFALTEAGVLYFEGCRDSLLRLRQTETAVRELGDRPRGDLRIACPILRPETIIGPLLISFSHAYPEINVHVHLSSEPYNPMVDGFDVVVQIGVARQAALIARCLLRERYTLVASPEYLRRRGTPRTVADLAEHDCIVAVRAHGVREPWPLRDGGAFTVERPRLCANAAGLIRMATVDGLGIGLNAQSLVREDLAAGTLVPVLEGVVEQIQPISLLYPAGSKLSPKVRCFVEHASAWVDRLGGGDGDDPSVYSASALPSGLASTTT